MGKNIASESTLSYESIYAQALSDAGSGYPKLAETGFRRVTEINAQFAPAHHNLGVALLEQHKLADAAASIARALEIDPNYLEARHNLANVYRAMDRLAEAEREYRVVIGRNPEKLDSLHDLGTLLNQLRRPEEAAILFRQTIRLKTDFVDGYNGLGLALLAIGRLDEAAIHFEEALRIDPRSTFAHNNLATTYKELGRLTEAVAQYDLALLYDPESASAHWNRALALLQAGDYERGWPEYEWRWRRPASPPRNFNKPIWDGSAQLDGKTVLLHAEQGLGDAIQFIRFAAPLKELGARTVFECPSPLLEIVQNCGGLDHVQREGDPLPDFDFHLPLMSAPSMFRTTMKTIPASVPYLTVSPDRVQSMRAKIAAADKLTVGITWQGNPHHQLDRHRSAPLEAFAPIQSAAHVKLVSLQRGPGSEQIDHLKCLHLTEVLSREVNSGQEWADTAALIAAVDLVVTVDTVTAHIAGALGKPVWILLSKMPDWRWCLHRNDTPWYPTARLFRQATLCDWREPMQQIIMELESLNLKRRDSSA